jgi:hypothetical protein
MSPTSYQTAPPRDKDQSIGAGARRVKRMLNKINTLQGGFIPLGLTRVQGKFRSTARL